MKNVQLILLLIGLMATSACNKDNISVADQEKTFVKYFGHSGDQAGTDLIETKDGNFLIFGTTNSFNESNNKDFYIVKVDGFGNELWSAVHGTSADEESIKVVEVDDGFLLLGNTILPDGSFQKIFIVKTNNIGQKTWQNTLRENTNFNEWAVDIASLTNGGYVVTGTTEDLDTSKPNPNPDRDKTDVYIGLLDAEGEEGNFNIEGFPGIDNSIALFGGDKVSLIYASEEIATDSTVLQYAEFDTDDLDNLGSTDTPILGQTIDDLRYCATRDGGHAFLFKTIDQVLHFASLDANFDLKTTPVTLNTTANDIPNDLLQTRSGFIMTSTTPDQGGLSDLLLTKLTDGGIEEWRSPFGRTEVKDQAGAILQTVNDGYLFTGEVGLSTNQMTALFKTNSRGELSVE